MDAAFETLASGYGLVEGPTFSPDGSLYWSDVLGGGVHRRDADGTVSTVIPQRRGVGGIALHADGGLVVGGRDLIHVRDGANRTLLSIEGLPGWNDLCTDARGRQYGGSIPPPLIRPEVIADLRQFARAELPPPLFDLVDRTEQPFFQSIHDFASPRVVFGRVAVGRTRCARPGGRSGIRYRDTGRFGCQNGLSERIASYVEITGQSPRNART